MKNIITCIVAFLMFTSIADANLYYQHQPVIRTCPEVYITHHKHHYYKHIHHKHDVYRHKHKKHINRHHH